MECFIEVPNGLSVRVNPATFSWIVVDTKGSSGIMWVPVAVTDIGGDLLIGVMLSLGISIGFCDVSYEALSDIGG